MNDRTTIPRPHHDEPRRQLIINLRDRLWDWDQHVDRRRQELEDAIAGIRDAVSNRDAIARRLHAAIMAEQNAA